MVCHFYRPSTRLCLEADEKLDALARRYLHLRVVKINVERAAFLCDRLKIFVIPTIMLIKKGKAEHSLLGFDELGGKETFELSDLERVLLAWNFLQPRTRSTVEE